MDDIVGTSVLDGKFTIQSDDEQYAKLNEILELLVSAGYFRAKIQGLSVFDKVVGGMVYCISLSAETVDVDLLYSENSSIGQKIALTENIVKVLPKFKCPHSIEPHQIQGLDCIRIFPVISVSHHRSLISSLLSGLSMKQLKLRSTMATKFAIFQHINLETKAGVLMANDKTTKNSQHLYLVNTPNEYTNVPTTCKPKQSKKTSNARCWSMVWKHRMLW